MRGGRRRMAVASAAVAALGANVAASAAPAQSPEGTPARIVFSSDGRLFTIDASGADRRQLTGPQELGRRGRDYEPAWSPDGSQIAFVRDLRGDRSEIRSIGVDGSDERVLVPARHGVEHESLSGPEWSPDGRAIAFSRFRFTGRAIVSSIVVAPVDGGSERTVTQETARSEWSSIAEPAFAPDGSRLIFTRTVLREDGHFDHSLYMVRRDGTGERMLEGHASAAAWSPDGTRIAFASIRDRNGSQCGSDQCYWNGEIYVIDADGTDRARLTDNPGDDEGPTWSADGERIAFASDRNYPINFGDPELYSVVPDGSCLTWLTNGTAASGDPDWAPSSGATSTPGACGATSRSPLIEVDPAAGVRDRPVLWLGLEYGSLLLSYSNASRHDASFVYADCGAYEPDQCGPEVQVQSWSTCSRFSVLGENPSILEHMRKRRGALVSHNFHGEGLVANTGAAEIRIFLDSNPFAKDVVKRHLDVFDDLRQVGGDEPTRLPPPALPRSKLRDAQRARDAVRRLGSIDAARRELGMNSYDFRASLRLAKIDHRFGPIEAADCPR